MSASLERGRHLGGRGRARSELPAQGADGGRGSSQLLAGAQGLGAPTLPVGQPLGGPLAVLGLIELGAVSLNPGLAQAASAAERRQRRGPGRSGSTGDRRGRRSGSAARIGDSRGIGGGRGIGADDLGDYRSQLPDGLLGGIDRAGGGPAALGEPVLDLAEPIGAEQLLQQLLARLSAAACRNCANSP